MDRAGPICVGSTTVDDRGERRHIQQYIHITDEPKPDLLALAARSHQAPVDERGSGLDESDEWESTAAGGLQCASCATWRRRQEPQHS
jgi:hypothetical protein